MEPTEALFRQLVESSPDGFWAIDLQGRTVYANPRAAELLGRSPTDMARLTVFDVLDDAGRTQLERHLEELPARGPHAHEVECSYLRPDGGYVRLVVSETALTGDDGRLVGVVHRMTDDEHRQRLIDELSRSRTLLDEAQSIARIGSWEVTLDSGVTFWSRHIYDLVGLDPERDTPTTAAFMKRVNQDDALDYQEWIRRVVVGGGEFENDQRLRTPDGREVWVRSRAVARYDDDGTLVGIGGTLQDISDVKSVESQLLDAVVLNALLQVTVTAANNADTVADAFTGIRTHLLGHEDWVKTAVFQVQRDDDGQHRLAPYLADRPEYVPDPLEWATAERVLRERGIVFEEEARPENPLVAGVLVLDGEPLYIGVLTAAAPFRRRSMVRSLLSQVIDQLRRVAERERDATVLAAARDAAMEASRLKSGFLAMISHEIRTPLNGVLGLNELLANSALDAQQRRLVEGIEVAGRSLLGLISDILDFSKIEAGQLELESVVFDVRALVARALTVVSADAANKGLTLRVDVDPEVPVRLLGDPTRVQQVLTNLLSNAVKFTSQGAVTVQVTAHPATAADTVVLRTEVEDTGIGIDAATVQRLFEPFQQANASTTRTHGGSGLGLAISRQLVQALGGELAVSTEPGRGSTFWFTAPFTVTEDRSPTPEEPATPAATTSTGEVSLPTPVARGRVLVVEDNEINRMVATGLLESLGYACDVAVNGVEAVEKVAAHGYDVVLMDLQMPLMDGIAATRAIRASQRSGPRVPIIALTASAITGEREKCLAAGMDDFLSKPVNLEWLESTLTKHIRPVAAGGADTPEAPTVNGVDRQVPAQASPVLTSQRLDELLAMGERAKPLVQRAATNFIANLPGTLADLEKAVADLDSPTLRSVAHKLRGSALNLGATRIGEVTLDLELLADDGRAGEAGPLVEVLNEVGDATVAALAAYLAENGVSG